IAHRYLVADEHEKDTAAVTRSQLRESREIAPVVRGRHDQYISGLIDGLARVGRQNLLDVGDSNHVRDRTPDRPLNHSGSRGFGAGAMDVSRHVPHRPGQNEGAPDERSSAVTDVVSGGICRLPTPGRPRTKSNCSGRPCSEIVMVGTGPPGRPAKPSP